MQSRKTIKKINKAKYKQFFVMCNKINKALARLTKKYTKTQIIKIKNER